MMEKSLKMKLKLNNLFLSFLVLSSAALAEEYKFGGNLKLRGVGIDYSSEEFLGTPAPDSSEIHVLQGRLNSSVSWDEYEGVLEVYGGFRRDLGRQLPVLFQAGQVISDRTALFDMTQEESFSDDVYFYGRVDRASFGWQTDAESIKFGRMALTWGQGMTFNIQDIVNPFPPAIIDAEYKPGADMLYLSKTFGVSTRVELAAVPRRAIDTHELEYEESTLALRVAQMLADSENELQLTAAHHYNRALLGLGFNHPWQGAIIRADVLAKERTGGGADISFIGNIDRGWEIFERNWYTSFEYFHSGSGADSNEISEFSEDLSLSLVRGDLFTVGTDYLALGMRQEVTPLFNLYQLYIQGLNPAGSLLQLKGVYDLSENITFTVAGTLGLGGSGSEFSGVKQQGLLIERGDSLFLQIARYF